MGSKAKAGAGTPAAGPVKFKFKFGALFGADGTGWAERAGWADVVVGVVVVVVAATIKGGGLVVESGQLGVLDRPA